MKVDIKMKREFTKKKNRTEKHRDNTPPESITPAPKSSPEETNNHPFHPNLNPPSLPGADVLSTVLWLSRTLVNQSVAQIPNVPGSRILLYFWWMTALVITASYMGNLIAFLTVAVQPTTAKTLKETMKFDFPLSVD